MSSTVVDAVAVRALARQRHDVIVAEVRRRGAVRVSELSTLLGVSDMTIRRDLEMLDETGLVTKVHGGATLRAERSSDEPGFEAKSLRNMAEKHAIAMVAAAMVTPGSAIAGKVAELTTAIQVQRSAAFRNTSAAAMITPGSAIGITAGTTTWQLAYHLVDIPHLTVVTNSVRVSDVLYRAPRTDRTVVLTGGDRTPSDALVGPVALATLRTLHLDVVCMGVHGMAADAGFTTPNLQEAETNRAFVDSTQHLMVLADHTKWNIIGLSTIAPLDRAATVISDRWLPAAARTALKQMVPQLVLADPQFNEVPAPFETRAADRRRANG